MKVILVAAISLDGFITRHDEPGSDFTSEADSRYLGEILPRFDCAVFGGRSYRVAPEWMRTRLMPGKLRVVMTRSPDRYAGQAERDSFEFTDGSPPDIVDDLRSRGFRACALLGGGQVYSAFLQAGCVDELWLTLEARLFGNGTPLCPGSFDLSLRLLSHQPLDGDTLLLKYAPASPGPNL